MHAQLVALAGNRRQAVAGPVFVVLHDFHGRAAIGLARHFMHAKEMPAFFHATGMLTREHQIGSVWRHRLIDFVNGAISEQALINTACGALNGENHQPGGIAVYAVNGRQLGQIKLTLEAHQQRVLQILPRRHHGQEMRLVRHQQMRITVNDLRLERNEWLSRQFTIVVIAHARHERRGLPGFVPPFADHLPSLHAPEPVNTADRRQTLAEKVDQQALPLTRQHHATGADTLSDRQNFGIVCVMHGPKF